MKACDIAGKIVIAPLERRAVVSGTLWQLHLVS